MGCKESQRTSIAALSVWLELMFDFGKTSTVILGASKPEQVIDNLKALEVLPKLTPEVMEKIETILNNKPAAEVCMICSV